MRYQLTCTKDDGEGRLDRYLHGKIGDLSRGALRKIIELGGVHLAGRRCHKCGATVAVGARVEVYLDGGPLDPFRLSEGNFLFVDRYLAVINKPAGVETQSTPARYRGTLYEALLVRLRQDMGLGRDPEIGMPQRLDRDTSGIIVFSIHPSAHKELTRQISERLARKEYLAIISGCPQEERGRFHSFLRRDRNTGRVQSCGQGGQEAITDYTVLAGGDGLSLVHVLLHTGRTHQIRAHFAEAGHPLAGDRPYGGPVELGGRVFPRQCLHSWRLSLVHPHSGKQMSWTAPLPEDMTFLGAPDPARIPSEIDSERIILAGKGYSDS
ncbi:MAG: RluA family pseudouridine synthase [Desulforhopalus sp.]|nr:RluA family pseudouridine synthase [Desulforhopalus sp.]